MEATCCLSVVPLPAIDTVPVVVVGPPKIKQLESTAQELNRTINHNQKSLAANYWKLGDILLALRPLYPHGTWEDHLTRLGIELTRSKRATWFRNTYTTLTKAEKIESPTKAYAERDRKQIQKRKRKAESPLHCPAPQKKTALDHSAAKQLKIAGTSMPVLGQEVASAQLESVSEEEFLVFSSFVKACDGLGRAMQIFEACCSIYKEVAVNE